MTNKGYIAVEASGCGEDITYWVLDQTQMDEVDLASQTNRDFCEVMNNLIEDHGLGLNGRRFPSIKTALDYMTGQGMTLEEDFNYLSY